MLPPAADRLARARSRFGIDRLQRIAHARADHFWHAPRRTLLLRLLVDEGLAAPGRPVLDAGCGTGGLVDALRAAGFDAIGLDPWGDSDAESDAIRQGTLDRLPFADGSFATVCLLDVLEHVDEAESLREVARVLVPDGRVLVTVPAHAWLWSPRDDAAGHLRRYSRRSLRKCLDQAGFVTERLFGYQLLLLPLAALARLRARLLGDPAATDAEDRPSEVVNRVLRFINLAEVALGRFVPMPTGTSLVAIARVGPRSTQASA